MKLISCLLVAVTLLASSSLALADPGHRDHDRRGQRHGERDHRQIERRHADYRNHDNHRYDRHHDRHRDYRRYGYHPVYPRYRHARWERGHRYHGPTYVVGNYGYYRLRPPPYGYHWVRADNDFLLVAISTGIILDLALR